MKEAAGEASMTVIAIVLIGLIALIATPIIKNNLGNVGKSSYCQSLGYEWKQGQCFEPGTQTTITITCTDGNCTHN